MYFMNDMEIDDMAIRYRNHPVLGPATRTLAGLRDAANRNSDGWAYWPKPARAAEQLMRLIEGDDPRLRWNNQRADATKEKLKRAYVPVRAFRTRSKLQFEIYEPDMPTTARILTISGVF